MERGGAQGAVTLQVKRLGTGTGWGPVEHGVDPGRTLALALNLEGSLHRAQGRGLENRGLLRSGTLSYYILPQRRWAHIPRSEIQPWPLG